MQLSIEALCEQMGLIAALLAGVNLRVHNGAQGGNSTK